MSFYPPSPSLESIASSALTTSDEDFNLDPMVFDSIVHTERPTMPEPVEDARDHVQIRTSREDWMRFQAREQQRYIPEVTSSSAPEEIDKHARFFLPAGNIYFSIENTLYSVPRAPFEKHSSTAFAGKGLTEDDPLVLEDVKAAHFDHLLSILYPSEYGSGVYTAVTVDDWTAILHLAVRWGFQSIKTLAITAWLHEAVTAVCMREQIVTKAEGRRMRVDDIIEINAIHQLFGPAAQPSALSIGEACADFDILQFVSLPEPATPPVSEGVASAEKSREAAALFLGQLNDLRTSCLAQFKKETLDGLKGDNYHFANVVAKAKERCETRFKTGAQEAIVAVNDWTWDDEMILLSNERILLSNEIVSVGDQCRKDETKKMLDLIERNFKHQIHEPVHLALKNADPRMWDQVLTSFKEILEKAESTYLAKAKSKESSTALATLRKRAWLALRARIDEQTADDIILSKLQVHFEKLFRYNERGALRVWNPQDDLDGAFKKAQDRTLELLQFFSKISPVEKSHAYILPPDAVALSLPDEVFDFDTTLTVLTEKQRLHLAAKFRGDAHTCYFDTKHNMVVIPLWMYGVLALPTYSVFGKYLLWRKVSIFFLTCKSSIY
ncbi:RHD3-domain-containing protein [Athelia psychrophila]|uniref:RHD3-domain-containing protein n=1 Tax=Athelia psychrophila TaxID=1759441 RepID=A0A166AE26_9AGAM|nr:RHD3-domain-containing protein [Fibularhizoctonia sp. CBS 109695]